MKRNAKRNLYTKKLFRIEQTGMPPNFFEKYGKRITFIDEDTEVANGVYAANIGKHRHYPQYSSMMYYEQGGKLVHDDLSHELFINIETDDGNVVLTGCAHHGLINILETASENYGKIYAVIGGFHLNGTKNFGMRIKKESHHEIRAIAKYFEKNGIRKVYTGHCTGDKPLEKLRLLSRTKKMQTGDIIKI